MSKKRKFKRLTNDEILRMFNGGKYRLIDGEVWGSRGPIQITKNHNGYSFVRLYSGKSRRQVPLSMLIWMVATKQVPPKNFVIHHRDRDITNNSFSNLYALHKTDHKKLHSNDLVEEQVPF